MCEFCNEERKQNFDYPATEMDLRLQWKNETKGLNISYEKWLEERTLRGLNEAKRIKKANQEFQKIIENELGE